MTNARSPSRPLPFSALRPRIAATLCLVLLAGCTTTRTSAEATDAAAPKTGTATDAKGILAKGGTTASNRYRDPMVSTGARQMQARNGIPTEAAPEVTDPAAGGTTAQASPSIAGLATQPTGVRAGSFSIFSSPVAPNSGPEMATGAVATETSASALVPEAPGPAQATGRVNAAMTSVFSARQSIPGCGTDAAGNALSC